MTTVFEQPIESVMARDGEHKVPLFIKQTLGYLNSQSNVEGLFTVTAGVKDVDKLKAEFDTGNDVKLDGIDVHLVAGLVKAYFIALPEPLLTFAAYDEFIEAADAPDCAAKLKEIFQKLPEVNKLVAGCLFHLLSRVAEAETESKMTANNLAIIFGQILLRPKVESLTSLLRHSPKITSILKSMIENYSKIIPASPEEAQLISDLITPGKGGAKENKLSPEEQKLHNIKLSADDSIQIVLERLDAMSKELANTSSLEETIEIAKRVRTAKRFLFANEPPKA